MNKFDGAARLAFEPEGVFDSFVAGDAAGVTAFESGSVRRTLAVSAYGLAAGPDVAGAFVMFTVWAAFESLPRTRARVPAPVLVSTAIDWEFEDLFPGAAGLTWANTVEPSEAMANAATKNSFFMVFRPLELLNAAAATLLNEAMLDQ